MISCQINVVLLSSFFFLFLKLNEDIYYLMESENNLGFYILQTRIPLLQLIWSYC